MRPSSCLRLPRTHGSISWIGCRSIRRRTEAGANGCVGSADGLRCRDGRPAVHEVMVFVQQLIDLFTRQFFAFKQGLSQAVQLVAVLFQMGIGPIVGLAKQFLDFLIDRLGGSLAEVAWLLNFLAEEDVLL